MPRVSSWNPQAISSVLKKLITDGSVFREGDEITVDAMFEGSDAKELNRSVLSASRRVEKKTLTRRGDGFTARGLTSTRRRFNFQVERRRKAVEQKYLDITNSE